VYWVNVSGRGSDEARLENVSHETLHQIVPLLAALGAGVQMGRMGSDVVEGGCFRQTWVGSDPLRDAIVDAAQGVPLGERAH